MQQSAAAPDVVHVGSACRDLTDDDERGWRLGGGVSYAALTTARLGLRTAAVIGVDRVAGTATELDLLRDAGVAVRLVALDEGPVFRNLETPHGRIQHWPTRGRPLPVPALPAGWVRSGAWSLVPVASELDDAWAAAVPEGAFVSLAWQGLLREQGPDGLTRQRPPGPSRLLGIADLVGVSRQDLPPEMPMGTLEELVRHGARVAITDGYHGGQIVVVRPGRARRVIHWNAIAPDRVVDPTGAGDVYLAALLSAAIRPDLTVERARRTASDVEFAAAAASLVVEAPGMLGVPELPAVLDRLG